MSHDIQPVQVTDYNATDRNKNLSFTVSATTIVEETAPYLVCVEKMEVPVNSKNMPINSSTESFNLAIFCEYKDGRYPGLEYGVNLFSIPGPIYSVKGFIKSLNDIIFKLPGGILGYFELDSENNIFYQYDKQHADEHNEIRIYFDSKLRRLFTFDYDSVDRIGEMWRLAIVRDFVPTGSTQIERVESEEFTFPLFYNLKAIRIRTSLPVAPHLLFNRANGKVEMAPILMDITYNTATMFNSRNLLYHPNSFVYRSMSEAGTLRAFDLNFFLFYADGTELPLQLEPLDFASISLSFEHKKF